MDRQTDSSARMTLLWPHTAACLSVTLYLPASLAKYFQRGEGGEKFITIQTTRENYVLEKGENHDQDFTRIPDQIHLFSNLRKYTASTQGRAEIKYTITFDLSSSLAHLLIRLCQGSDYTKANYTYLVALTVSSGGCCNVNLGC